VDIGDFLSFIPIDPGGPRPSRARTTEESAAQVLALALLPILYVSVVLLAGLPWGTTLTLVLIPVGLAAVAYFGSRRIGTGVGFALGQAIGCGLICAFCGLCAIFLGIFTGLFSSF
jgi:hypothetical protein